MNDARRKRLIALTGVIALTLPMLLAALSRCAEQDGPWLVNDWPAAQRQAAAKHLPIFVVFH